MTLLGLMAGWSGGVREQASRSASRARRWDWTICRLLLLALVWHARKLRLAGILLAAPNAAFSREFVVWRVSATSTRRTLPFILGGVSTFRWQQCSTTERQWHRPSLRATEKSACRKGAKPGYGAYLLKFSDSVQMALNQLGSFIRRAGENARRNDDDCSDRDERKRQGSSPINGHSRARPAFSKVPKRRRAGLISHRWAARASLGRLSRADGARGFPQGV